MKNIPEHNSNSEALPTAADLKPANRILTDASARCLLLAAFVVVVLVQVADLIWIGNGIEKLGGDGHGDADTVRSAEAYFKDGLTSHHGLPRILYGNRFPAKGTIVDHLDTNGLVKTIYRTGFPAHLAAPDDWVYTHYPPGPTLLCGMSARVLGMDPIWRLRLLPLGIGLLAVAILFRTLTRVFGMDRGALMAVAFILLPTLHTHMHALHFTGYAFALLLLQLCVLFSVFWGSGTGRWQMPALFVLGFFQGWLSFDMFFVVTLLALPFWLLRRAERGTLPLQWLILTVAMPFLGFGLAHFLHFLQVAAELGGLRLAYEEFTRTAGERAGQQSLVLPQLLQTLLGRKTDQFGYLGSLGMGAYFYVREILILRGLNLGPFVLIAMVITLPLVVFRGTELTVLTRSKKWLVHTALSWPGTRSVLPAIGAALFVSLAWLLVMPAHVVGNSHITVRHLALLYFCAVLAIVRSLSIRRTAPGRQKLE